MNLRVVIVSKVRETNERAKNPFKALDYTRLRIQILHGCKT